MSKYAKWIAENVTNTYGRCREWTHSMAACFPELTLVRGHYWDSTWGDRAHWWLVAPDGSIVDPTAEQFPSKGTGDYQPLDESLPEPTGMCPNCGGLAYNHDTFCSDACGAAYVAYCNNPRSYA